MNFVSVGQALHQLDVVGFGAVFGEDDILGFQFLVLIFDGLADFVDALSEKGVRVACLDDPFEGSVVINSFDFCGHWRVIKIIIY